MTKYRIVKETNALGEERWYVEERICFLWWRLVDISAMSFNPPYKSFPTQAQAERYIERVRREDERDLAEKQREKKENKIIKREVVG